MTILVSGKTGQLARALADQADVTCLGRNDANLADPEACAQAIRDNAPRAVINAAAYTAVDRAEEEADLAMVVNGDAPTAMAEACAALGIPFCQVSTEYVFDGSGSAPRTPNAPVAPLNAYGASKLAGEDGVRAAGGAHVILRTSWVFDQVGANFVNTMLRLGAERESLNVVDDQVGGPTPAPALAQACLRAVEALAADPSLSGTYHFAGAPDVSWAGFAREIMALAGHDCTINPIPTADYPTPAARPLNSRLDCSATRAAFGLERPDWRAALAVMIQNHAQRA